MTTLERKLADSSRLAVIIATLVALAVLGSGAAAGLFGSPTDAAVPVQGTSQIAEDNSEQESGDLPENMVPTSDPDTQPRASLQHVAGIKTDNSNGRLRIWNDGVSEADAGDVTPDSSSPVLTTSSLVNPDLGHQFTLVGARPSGTS